MPCFGRDSRDANPASEVQASCQKSRAENQGIFRAQRVDVGTKLLGQEIHVHPSSTEISDLYLSRNLLKRDLSFC
jgi:hypothetical protein